MMPSCCLFSFLSVVPSCGLSGSAGDKLVLGCGSNVVDHIYNVKGIIITVFVG